MEEEIKKEKIKNKHYRAFLKQGIIEILSEEQIVRALNNVTGKYVKEGRSLLIALYYTGARPVETLVLRSDDITRQGSYVLAKLQGSKRGLPRTVYLKYKLPLVQELLRYASSLPPGMLMFYHYRNDYKRKYKDKLYTETSAKLRYYFEKWFAGVVEDPIPPYYLRHNRFSKLSEKGVDLQQLRMIKGSKTDSSVIPYLHLSSKTAKDVARKLD